MNLYYLCSFSFHRNFVEEKLGVKYTEGRKTEFAKSFRESGPASPMFFILSPGVDPLKDVESLGTLFPHTYLNMYNTVEDFKQLEREVEI